MESALRRSAPADLTLIETFRWEPGAGSSGCRRISRGWRAARRRSASPFDRAAVDRALAAVAGTGRCGCG